MKQKDIALIILVGAISAVLSVMLSNFLITPSNTKKQEAEVVDPISSSFQVPSTDNKYFNKDSLNPTKLIEIGNSTNQSPFNGETNQ